MELQFVKMHGIGNDFVLVDCMSSDTPEPGQLARTLCRRRFGIGADGLLAVCPSEVADYRMRIFNADGSEAGICGNGLRCVGKYAYEHGISRSIEPAVETGAGVRRLHLAIGSDNRVEAVTVNMGHAVTAPALVPLNTVTALINSPVENCGEELRLTALSVGNPHGVVFVSDLYGCKFELLGPRLEWVVAMHLSENNNRPSLVERALQAVLDRRGHGAGLQVAAQHFLVSVPPA